MIRTEDVRRGRGIHKGSYEHKYDAGYGTQLSHRVYLSFQQVIPQEIKTLMRPQITRSDQGRLWSRLERFIELFYNSQSVNLNESITASDPTKLKPNRKLPSVDCNRASGTLWIL